MTGHADQAETVVGQDPRKEALELLDGAWTTRLVEAEQDGGSEKLAETQLAAAQITALIYIGDQLGALIQTLSCELPFAGRGNS